MEGQSVKIMADEDCNLNLAGLTVGKYRFRRCCAMLDGAKRKPKSR